MRYILIFVILAFGFFPSTSFAEEMVTVRLKNHVGETNEVTIQWKGAYVSLDPTLNIQEGVKYRLFVQDGSLFLKDKNEEYRLGDSLILVPRAYDEEHITTVNNRPYLGAMEFRIEDNQFIRPVNQLPLEDYLKGVVPFEVFPSWNVEALKAQALAARTYAVSHNEQEMDDTISYQVYGGYSWNETTTKAVEETKGEVITYQDQLIQAFYSASNGGYTENNAHVWGGKPKSYFPIKNDPYDPVHPWTFELHKTQIALNEIDWDANDWWEQIEEKDQEITDSMIHWLNKHGYPGDIKILSIPEFELLDEQLVSKRSIKGSITVAFLRRLIDGTVLYHQLSKDEVDLNQIRPMIGGNLFKSYLIDSLQFDETKYTMKGRGYGHGVGMSQWGAHMMGEEGNSYREIIQFYFPGTTISRRESDPL